MQIADHVAKRNKTDHPEKDQTATEDGVASAVIPVLPVDTHVHRVSRRIGLIDAKTTPEKAHELLPRLLPRDPDVYWNFHLNMIRHGREVCVWARPRCERCVLTDLCDYYATVVCPPKSPA